jgi:hypothetical protein
VPKSSGEPKAGLVNRNITSRGQVIVFENTL